MGFDDLPWFLRWSLPWKAWKSTWSRRHVCGGRWFPCETFLIGWMGIGIPMALVCLMVAAKLVLMVLVAELLLELRLANGMVGLVAVVVAAAIGSPNRREDREDARFGAELAVA